MLKLKDLKGTYPATAIYTTNAEVLGIKLIAENKDIITQAMKASVEKQGYQDFKREDDVLYFGNKTFLLPTMPSFRKGVITFRSSDYYFCCPEYKEDTRSYGEKPKAVNLTKKGFVVAARAGKITYELELTPDEIKGLK